MERGPLCIHVDVTHMIKEVGCMRFVFTTRPDDAQGKPGAAIEVPMLIPYPVLRSIAMALPKVVSDMEAQGLPALFPDESDGV